MNSNVYNNGLVHVMDDKCSTCIFRPGNLMTLNAGRVKGMVDACIEEQGVIPCHKTTHGQREQQAVCRGFFDSYKGKIKALDLAEKVGIIEEVESE